jgi:hypothetical protein
VLLLASFNGRMGFVKFIHRARVATYALGMFDAAFGSIKGGSLLVHLIMLSTLGGWVSTVSWYTMAWLPTDICRTYGERS